MGAPVEVDESEDAVETSDGSDATEPAPVGVVGLVGVGTGACGIKVLLSSWFG